jgi:2-methylcitrate dehydratase PrpD
MAAVHRSGTTRRNGDRLRGRTELPSAGTGRAGGQYEPRAQTFHPPGIVGVIGSAVGSAYLLGLDVERIRHAVGIAASRATSLIGNIGTMTKCAHCGAAAAAGLDDAALLAARGFTANPDIGFRSILRKLRKLAD